MHYILIISAYYIYVYRIPLYRPCIWTATAQTNCTANVCQEYYRQWPLRRNICTNEFAATFSCWPTESHRRKYCGEHRAKKIFLKFTLKLTNAQSLGWILLHIHFKQRSIIWIKKQHIINFHIFAMNFTIFKPRFGKIFLLSYVVDYVLSWTKKVS